MRRPFSPAEQAAADAYADKQEAEVKRLREASPDDLRAKGWTVAVHNDYRLGGKRMTFWLLTHTSGFWIKGEGETDAEALNQARKCDAVELADEHDATLNSGAYD